MSTTSSVEIKSRNEIGVNESSVIDEQANGLPPPPPAPVLRADSSPALAAASAVAQKVCDSENSSSIDATSATAADAAAAADESMLKAATGSTRVMLDAADHDLMSAADDGTAPLAANSSSSLILPCITDKESNFSGAAAVVCRSASIPAASSDRDKNKDEKDGSSSDGVTKTTTIIIHGAGSSTDGGDVSREITSKHQVSADSGAQGDNDNHSPHSATVMHNSINNGATVSVERDEAAAKNESEDENCKKNCTQQETAPHQIITKLNSSLPSTENDNSGDADGSNETITNHRNNNTNHLETPPQSSSTTTTVTSRRSPELLETTPSSSRLRNEIADSTPKRINKKKNGHHCIIHTPSLEELQSTTFSNYIRTTVLPAASLYEVDNKEDKRDACDSPYMTATKLQLREGIAKIRLPDNFWKPPYGTDRTGRGDQWQAGTALGDWKFSSPIQQNIRGMAGIYEYTHTELPATTLAAFRDRADQYRIEQMGSAMIAFKKNEDGEKDEDLKKDDTSNDEQESSANATSPEENNTADEEVPNTRRPGEYTEAQIDQLERQFWKRLSPTMPPAVYGADEAGTLFGDDPASGWSIGNLDSCLHVLPDIPGVTSPYLYAGMWASVFCAHAEDMNLLSINYLHAGQPKLWYAVAETDAARFVSLAEHHYIHQWKKCREFLRHKLCLLSPAILKKAGIRYQTAVQYPGDAIITFPGGFHFGFNSGFNIAEATNFGVPEWLPFGRQAKVCLCRPDSVRIDVDRLTVLLQRFQRDQKRNKRLTWKQWRKRQERKEGFISESLLDPGDDDVEIHVVRYSNKRKKKRKSKGELSDQQQKNEFWIEVIKPVSSDGKVLARKQGQGGKKAGKKEEIWHLAKPLNRKRLEVQAKVLCLVPTTRKLQAMPQPNDDSDSWEEGEKKRKDEEDEQCFAGTVVEIADGHARIHLEGMPRSDDIWIPASSPKLFLDGGRWVEDHEAVGIPPLHYWQEMDSKKRVCVEK